VADRDPARAARVADFQALTRAEPDLLGATSRAALRVRDRTDSAERIVRSRPADSVTLRDSRSAQTALPLIMVLVQINGPPTTASHHTAQRVGAQLGICTCPPCGVPERLRYSRYITGLEEPPTQCLFLSGSGFQVYFGHYQQRSRIVPSVGGRLRAPVPTTSGLVV
jgi:hypothetical protein